MLEEHLHGYNNPTGTCQSCTSQMAPDVMGCCDLYNTIECNSGLLCDSYFYYCLRALGSEGEDCSYFGNVTSNVNCHDAFVDFSQSPVLGLDNPLILPGLTNNWNISMNIHENSEVNLTIFLAICTHAHHNV